MFSPGRTGARVLTAYTARLCAVLNTPLIVLLRDSGAAVFIPDNLPVRIFPEQTSANDGALNNTSRDLACLADALERYFANDGDIAGGVRHVLA